MAYRASQLPKMDATKTDNPIKFSGRGSYEDAKYTATSQGSHDGSSGDLVKDLKDLVEAVDIANETYQYSQYLSVGGFVTWVGKNGNRYRSTTHNLNNVAYRGSALLAQSRLTGVRTLGRGLAVVNGVFLARDLINARNRRDLARVGVQSIAFIVSFMGPIGFAVGLAITVADEAGAFDSLYEKIPE